LQLKPGAKPFHGKPFPIPRVHKDTLRKEVERLVEIGVLKRQPTSEWVSPTFIIPKKNKTVRFISDFREVNKHIVRTPFPIPKISTVLQKMEKFTYATTLDLNMDCYTIRLGPDAQKIYIYLVNGIRYDYLSRHSNTLVLHVRSFVLPKGLPDSKAVRRVPQETCSS